jgi:hypothetical protein
MKKTYISPVMDVIEIEKQTLLAGSTLPLGDPVDDASDAEAPEYHYDGF